MYIYEKCDNVNNKHIIADYNDFREMYYKDEYTNIDLNLYVYQRFYIKCLFDENKIINYGKL